MKVKEKLMMDGRGIYENGPINIVIFGDSISQGCIDNYSDYESVYWHRLRRMLNKTRDYVPVNMINVALGGLTAKRALPRLHKHALIHQPDLMIVSFGVNDVNEPLEDYLDALKEIFSDCLAAGCEVVFMTECMMNTYVAPDTAEDLVAYATKTAEMQNSGKVDLYFERAIALAKEMGVAVADCYARWKELSKTQDITLLLANRINHPIPEMHQLFADCLYETIIGDPVSTTPSGDGMMYHA